MSGFIADVQHNTGFRGNLLYMDLAGGMERELNYYIDNCNRRLCRRNNIRYSK
jgi:hypothetical protein